jgi:hypothetical protein
MGIVKSQVIFEKIDLNFTWNGDLVDGINRDDRI